MDSRQGDSKGGDRMWRGEKQELGRAERFEWEKPANALRQFKKGPGKSAEKK